MARKKIIVAYIANNAIRRATFRKRCRSILKKTWELATLCDVKACAVIYEPWEAQPHVWPNVEVAKDMLQQIKDTPNIEQSKKNLNQERFLGNRITKETERLCRLKQENHELELTILMLQALAGRSFHDLQISEISSLDCFISTKMKVVQDVIDSRRSQMGSCMTSEKASEDSAGNGIVE